MLPKPHDTIHLKNPMLYLLTTWLSLIKFCDPSWFCSVYALDLRFYVQMNLVLLKHCLTMLSKKKRDEKKACQRSMTQKRERERERERERKDGMPKKHDPANKIRHEKEHIFICALTWSVVNMSIHLWIQSLILQQFGPSRRHSTSSIETPSIPSEREVKWG